MTCKGKESLYLFNVETMVGCLYKSEVGNLCVRSVMSAAVWWWVISEGRGEDVPVKGEVMRAHTEERWRQ